MAHHQRMLPDDAVLRIVADMRGQGIGFDRIRKVMKIGKSRWERLMAIRDEQIEAERKAAEPKPVIGEPIKLCRVGQSLRNRLGWGPTDEAIRDMVRAHRAREAEQVAARSARAVLSGQSRVHRPATMPEASQ